MAEQRNAGDEPLPAPKVKPAKIAEPLFEIDQPPVPTMFGVMTSPMLEDRCD